MKHIRLARTHTSATIQAREGTYVTGRGLRAVNNAHARDSVTGAIVLVHLPGALKGTAASAWLLDGSVESITTRGAAAGPLEVARMRPTVARVLPEGATPFRAYVVDTNGRRVTRQQSNVTQGGVAGYLEKAGPAPCRLTKWTRQHPEQMAQARATLELADALYRRHSKAQHTRQLAAARRAPEYVIRDTAFSTVTVNRDFRTALHQDAGDFKGGLSALAVFLRGGAGGCDLCLPEYGVRVPMGDGDLLLFDPHLWHGNTSLKRARSGARRLSLVCYLRDRLAAQCAGSTPSDRPYRRRSRRKSCTRKRTPRKPR